jgi:hypothetical protein
LEAAELGGYAGLDLEFEGSGAGGVGLVGALAKGSEGRRMFGVGLPAL